MMDRHKLPPIRTEPAFLGGQLLIALPGISDKRFARSVIYLCVHSAEGAMGLIINQPAKGVQFSQLLEQLNIASTAPSASLHRPAKTIAVMCGGPVERERGFLLHSAEFSIDNFTFVIDEDISLTATVDSLRAIASGNGPKQALLALGCASWAPGQLDMELQHNGWLHGPANARLLFDTPIAERYTAALRGIGIDLARLSTQTGNA